MTRGFATRENIDEYIKNNPKNWEVAMNEASKTIKPEVGGSSETLYY